MKSTKIEQCEEVEQSFQPDSRDKPVSQVETAIARNGRIAGARIDDVRMIRSRNFRGRGGLFDRQHIVVSCNSFGIIGFCVRQK